MQSGNIKKLLGKGVYLLLVGSLLYGCVRNPITGKRELHMISEPAEARLGQEAKQAIIKEYGLYLDPQIQAYVNEVGHRVAQVADRRGITYEFVILDTSLVNAFAVPGVVFLTRGILDLFDDEAELATVIGHELGHINGYHSIKMIQESYGYGFLATFAAVAGTIYAPALQSAKEYAAYYETLYRGIGLVTAGFLTGYGREFELEADRTGLRYAILAGYDPDAMTSFFKRMQSLEDEKDADISIFLRTHPQTKDRIKQVKKILAEVEDAPKSGLRDRNNQKIALVLNSTSTVLQDYFDRYQARIKTLPKRTSAQNGAIEKNVYRNNVLGLRLEVPPRWKLEYGIGQSVVYFYSPDNKAQGELQVQDLKPDPVLSAGQQKGIAGVAASTEMVTSKQWAQSIEKTLKMEKRTGREVVYPAGSAYVGTYNGINRLGRPAFYKILYIVRGKNREELQGCMISCAAPEDAYLDYLVEIELVLKNFTWLD